MHCYDSCGIRKPGTDGTFSGFLSLERSGNTGNSSVCPRFWQALVHLRELLQRDLFGAQAGFRPWIDRFFAIDPGEIIAQGLAFLAEALAEEAQKPLAVSHAQVT